MKKLTVVLAAVLLAWNGWLTYRVETAAPVDTQESPSSSQSGNEAVVHHTVNGYITDITEMVSTVQPAVVEVTASSDDTARTVSGIIYDSSGEDCWIVTSAEILDGNSSYTVSFQNGLSVDAEAHGSDSLTDIGLLLCHPEFETDPVALGSSDIVAQGEYAAVIGGRQIATQGGFTGFGIVSMQSQMYRPSMEEGQCPWIVPVLTTDISVPRSCSGGALVNLSGQLIGMMSNPLTSANVSSGISTAVSVNEIISVVEDLKQEESRISRGYLGIMTENIKDLEVYQKSGMGIPLDLNDGLVITYMMEGSPAAAAGLKLHDVILSVNEEPMHTPEDLRNLLYTLNTADTAVLTVNRDGEEVQIQAVLG